MSLLEPDRLQTRLSQRYGLMFNHTPRVGGLGLGANVESNRASASNHKHPGVRWLFKSPEGARLFAH